MIFNITTRCQQHCSYCFQGGLNDQRQHMSLADVKRICEWDNSGLHHNVMGGEPTLNPELIPILRYLKESKPVNLLTNGLCDPQILKDTLPLNLGYLVNVNCFDQYSDAQFRQLSDNLRLLQDRLLVLSVTICALNQNFIPLYTLLDDPQIWHNVKSVRLSLSAPGYRLTNRRPLTPDTDWGNLYHTVADSMRKIKTTLVLSNECVLLKSFVSEEDYRYLESFVYNVHRRCKSHNLGVYPDFHAHWCPAAEGTPGLRVDSVFDYPDLAAVERKFKQTWQDLGSPACIGYNFD